MLTTTDVHPAPSAPPTSIPAPSAPNTSAISRAAGLTKVYGKGEAAVHALSGIDVAFAPQQFTAIMGPSGSGKSTLMHLLAGLDRPTSGTVTLAGQDLTHMKERQLTGLRRTQIGFIFQAYNLVATLTAEENITLPVELAHGKVDRDWLQRMVAVLGLADRLDHRPGELSGGQQQRVACARAMIARPAIVFADEPTGNLDSAASRDLLTFLRRSVDELGQTLVIVTHDPSAAAYADRVLFLVDGNIAADLAHPTEATILDTLHHISHDGGPRPGECEAPLRNAATATAEAAGRIS
ncbi:MAG: ABC transporter ATP-binding protein [Micrococcales bacterium]|nr:ABC transporter ATP-binding protein [Micrococcales bacterium]